MVGNAALRVIICSGPEDGRRATLGFAVAVAAMACGIAVHLFLVMNGVRWALRSEGDRPAAPGFQSISEMIETIQAGGGRIEICSSCVTGVCQGVPEAPQDEAMRDGILPGGLTSVAVRIGGIPTVTF